MKCCLLLLLFIGYTVNAQPDMGMKIYLDKLCAARQPRVQNCILKEYCKEIRNEEAQISGYYNKDVRIERRQSRNGPPVVSINGKQFRLDRIKPLNNYNKDHLDLRTFSVDKDQVSFHQWGKRKYYLIGGGIYRCNGSGCGISFYLIYDVQHKTLHAFRTFRVYARLMLVNVNNDADIDFIVINNEGWQEPSQFETEFWSVNSKGKMYLAKDRKGKPYRIKGSGSPFLEKVDSIKTLNWPFPVQF